MPPTTIRTEPALDSFTPLSEHQSQTPTSFYGAKPILHYHCVAAHALISTAQKDELPIFSATTNGSTNGQVNGDANATTVEKVNIFVSSENLTLWNPTASTGLAIPYPAISLHAIQRLPSPTSAEEVQGLYMLLELAPAEDTSEDEMGASVELTLIPPPSITPSNFDTTTNSAIQDLFTSVSNCSNLHPDPAAEGDEEEEGERVRFEGNVGYEGITGLPGAIRGATDGGLPPPFPGSGGWITAENVGEFFNADGEWIGGGDEDGEGEGDDIQVLGEGAGRVRPREDEEEEDDENKWRRTE